MGWSPRQWACAARLARAKEADSYGLALCRLRDMFVDDLPECDNPDWEFVSHMGKHIAGLYAAPNLSKMLSGSNGQQEPSA